MFSGKNVPSQKFSEKSWLLKKINMLELIIDECKQDPDPVFQILNSRNRIRPIMERIRNPASWSLLHVTLQASLTHMQRMHGCWRLNIHTSMSEKECVPPMRLIWGRAASGLWRSREYQKNVFWNKLTLSKRGYLNINDTKNSVSSRRSLRGRLLGGEELVVTDEAGGLRVVAAVDLQVGT